MYRAVILTLTAFKYIFLMFSKMVRQSCPDSPDKALGITSPCLQSTVANYHNQLIIDS